MSYANGFHYNQNIPWITSTQVAADWGALWIWSWVSLPEGGLKFWLQWQLADTVCSRSGHTICRGVGKQRTNTIPLSSAKPPASKLDFRE